MAKRSRKSKFDAVDRAHVRGGTLRARLPADALLSFVRASSSLLPSKVSLSTSRNRECSQTGHLSLISFPMSFYATATDILSKIMPK